MKPIKDRSDAEAQFRRVFVHLGAVSAYARRRGSVDPDGLAAEAMAIAWRKLSDIPQDDARPWLFTAARNLLYEERRKQGQTQLVDPHVVEEFRSDAAPPPQIDTLDPAVTAALRALSSNDREALLLVAWEDLSPKMAAKTLGIGVTAFRVRLHRARNRFKEALKQKEPSKRHQTAVKLETAACLEMEKS